MAYELDDKLVVGISTRALFDLDEAKQSALRDVAREDLVDLPLIHEDDLVDAFVRHGSSE